MGAFGDKPLTQNDFASWRTTIESLQEQVSCGCMGHLITISDVIVTVHGTVEYYEFKCVHCRVSYNRYPGHLTEKEHGLVDSLQ